jgi:type III secretory pathway component EscV
MKTKIEEVIKEVESSEKISAENKPLILEKLHEWKNEEKVVNDVAVRFENWWMEMEPIFAELGWI